MVLCALALPCLVSLNAHAQVMNGSFETGDFSDWVATDTQSTVFDPLSVRPTDTPPALAILYQDTPFADGYPVTDGNFSASHGFDGSGGIISISQDVMINDSILSFDWGASLFLLGEGSDREFNVNFRNVSDNTLLSSINIATFEAVFGTQDTGVIIGETVNVSDYIGNIVNIEFEWVVPDNATGPAASFLDNVALIPSPSTSVLIFLAPLLSRRNRL